MGMNQKVNKLLLALNMIGIPVKLQRMMRFNQEKKRLMTSYVLYREHPRKDGIFFGSSIALVKHLADLYKQETEGVSDG
ncbi:MAG: hypothetical protein RSD63_10720 [Eubacterium sp.]